MLQPVTISQHSVQEQRTKVAGTPMAVEPSLMASKEYSTWKRRPSGEKVL